MPLALNPPPPTPVEPVTEVLHGVPITDPYRWLEDQNSLRTRKWLEQQTAYARAYLDAIPGRERIRNRVEELLAVETLSEPWKVGSRYFYLKRTTNQQQPVIMMLESETGKETPLIAPVDRRNGTAATVSIVNISKDGGILAYSLRNGGEDFCSIGFFDVVKKKILSDCLPRGSCRGVVFSPRVDGYYYSHEAVAAKRPNYKAVYWHSFGANQDREVFVAGENPSLQVGVLSSSDGSILAYPVCVIGDPNTNDLYVQEIGKDRNTRQIVRRIKGLFGPFFIGSGLFAITDLGAPNYRVVAIDLGNPELEAWRDVVPESNSRIQDISVAGRLIFVSYVRDLANKIEYFDVKAGKRGEVNCPPDGTVRFLNWQPDGEVLFYRFSSFVHSPTLYCYDLTTGEQRLFSGNGLPFDLSSFHVEKIHYLSKDGTEVPMFLVSSKRLDCSHALPTFLTAYGGFGTSATPQFAAYTTFLIERGFLLAVANIRGGSEFGHEWHQAAKRHKRQNAFDDFIAAAEWLLERGYTQPRQLAIGGGSNAGLLIGAALTQRPDLFRAAVCLGPLLDMLRYHKFDQTNAWVEEYGCAETQDDFHYLQAYSPYHKVRDGFEYPAVMLISGDADTRCNPMHARKMAARLQAATQSGHPIILDYKPAWGHMPVQPLSSRIEALTDRLAFICHELGVTV